MPNFKITCGRCGWVTSGSIALEGTNDLVLPDVDETTPYCNWCMTLEECDAEIKKEMEGLLEVTK